MLGSEISAKIESYPCVKNNFKGIFAIDTIPSNLKVHDFIIFNLDLSNEKGSHRLVLFKKSNSVFECFDSLGFNPEKQALFAKYNKSKSSKILKFNETVFQPIQSVNCGLYAIYFSINRLLNLDLSYKNVLSEYFTLNTEQNDKIVKDFFTD